MKPDLSIVVPVFNEEEVLPEFERTLSEVLSSRGIQYEILFVNDGSRDQTALRLEELRKKNSRVKVLEFSRNFGHQSAMTAGLRFAQGKACVIMDADMQDPPSLILNMWDRWKEGYDVVYAVRRSRDGETVFKKATAALFYRTLRALSGVDIPPDTGDFRLMDRRVVDVLNALPERNRFLRGLVSWIGFRQVGVGFDRPPRAAGETKFSVLRMVRFALDGLTSFSRVPLRVVTLAGVGASLVSMGVLVWALWVRLFTERSVPGWTSLMGVVLLLGGAQLLAMGIVGEYIARIYDEAKHRPMYIVRDSWGFEKASPE